MHRTGQERPSSGRLTGMNTLAALVGFTIVGAGSPGPNNVLLWASGTEFGFRATLRHVAGSALGVGSMALVAAAGVGAVIAAAPGVALVMKVAASAYLLYLAWQIAGAHAMERGALSRPLGLGQATAFQLVNPKAWIVVLGAVGAFRPIEYPVVAGSVLVAVTMGLVVIPMASLWAGAGGLIGRLIDDDRARRVVSVTLAVLLVATVADVWA